MKVNYLTTNFEDLPIEMDAYEYQDGWKRTVKRSTTIKELLEIWDINEDAEIVQVLRHLRNCMKILQEA